MDNNNIKLFKVRIIYDVHAIETILKVGRTKEEIINRMIEELKGQYYINMIVEEVDYVDGYKISLIKEE